MGIFDKLKRIKFPPIKPPTKPPVKKPPINIGLPPVTRPPVKEPPIKIPDIPDIPKVPSIPEVPNIPGLQLDKFLRYLSFAQKLSASESLQAELKEKAYNYFNEYEDFILYAAELTKKYAQYVSEHPEAYVRYGSIKGVDGRYQQEFFRANQASMQDANQRTASSFFNSTSFGSSIGGDYVLGLSGSAGGYFDLYGQDHQQLPYGAIQGSAGIAVGASLGLDTGFWRERLDAMGDTFFYGIELEVTYYVGLGVTIVLEPDTQVFEGFSVAVQVGGKGKGSAFAGYEWNF